MLCRLHFATGILLAFVFLPPGASAAADGQQSRGNTAGMLTWQLGDLAPGATARNTVFYVLGPKVQTAADSLAKARGHYKDGWSDPLISKKPAGGETAGKDNTWIKSDAADFAVGPDGSFRWENGRAKALRGQLGRTGYFIHYLQGSTHSAGVNVKGGPRRHRIKVVRPTSKLGADRCLTVLDAADGQIRLEIRSALGTGPLVAQEYVVVNTGTKPVERLRLSVFVNFDADHVKTGDHTFFIGRVLHAQVRAGSFSRGWLASKEDGVLLCLHQKRYATFLEDF